MKKIKLFFVGIMISVISFSQAKQRIYDSFIDSLYTQSKFQITIDSILFNNGIMEIIAVKQRGKKANTKVFIRKIIKVKTIENKDAVMIVPNYSGITDSKNEIYHPIPQPFQDKYIIVDCQNKAETVNIISINGGKSFSLNGFYFAINSDSTCIYTKSKDNKQFCKYNMKLGVLLKLNKIPEKENLTFNEIKDNEWVK